MFHYLYHQVLYITKSSQGPVTSLVDITNDGMLYITKSSQGPVTVYRLNPDGTKLYITKSSQGPVTDLDISALEKGYTLLKVHRVL